MSAGAYATLITYDKLTFLICVTPNPFYMQQYELMQYNTKTLVKTNEGSYDLIPFNNVGIMVIELLYPDGNFPSMLVIEDWLEIVADHFEKYPTSTLAVHCRCGLGRSAVLVAIALMESGLSPLLAVEMIRSKRQGVFNKKQIKKIYEYDSRNRLLAMLNWPNNQDQEIKKEKLIFKK
ncbi:probable protein tyrosine phosphatase type IVA A isoform X2 [Photinus pyralis]|uniref:probable protein tyrosine phosphatase type IVA A isoform X2 n=1 Tax=Photinus pyralis TaxID=7054 RepID=UPI001266F583|nr:probable protein tyrosine phosphatase type IVA A isoform X2 [Photinus pyralis]